MGVLRQKRDWKSVEARRFSVSTEWLGARLSSLPFTLTSAQQKTLEDIRTDLDSGKPMNRLVQGDVGSGKTVVAALAASVVVNDGAQAAIMAPTSILAEQHYRNFTSLLAGDGGMHASRVRSACWWGARPRRRKKRSVRVCKTVQSKSSSARMRSLKGQSSLKICNLL